MTVDPLGIGGPPGGGAPQAQQQPNFIGVQPWAVPTYPGATPFSPPSTTPPLSPSLASVAPAVDPSLPPGSIGVLSPKYQEGAENSLRGLPAEDLARLQSRLVGAGLIDKKERFRLGLADDTTVKAYYSLLGFANRYGITDEEALTRLEDVPITDSRGKKAPTTSTSTSTNKQTYVTPEATGQTTLRKAFEEELGRAPTDREYRVYQKALNGMERQSPATSVTTSTTNSETGNSTSSTVTTPSTAPGADVFADQTVRQGALGKERNTRKVTDYLDAAMSVLGAGGSGASLA